MRAWTQQLVLKAFARSLAGHLDQTQLGDFQNITPGFVFLESLLERVIDFLAVPLLFHVDEIDNDNAADVSQPELTNDLLDRFEIGLEDCLFLISFADEAPGVDVDSGQGFGSFDDDVTAGTQPDAPI